MPTLNEIIYNIRNVPNGGYSTRSQKLSDRQIANWVRYHRVALITEDLETRQVIDPTWEQDLGCLNLSEIDKANCPQHIWGEKVKTVKIPQLIKVRPKGAGLIQTLTFVGKIDKVTPIPIDIYGYGKLSQFTMYAPKAKIRASIIGNQIYISGTDEDLNDIVSEMGLCAINVRGIFADPLGIESCGEKKCFDWDKDCYPIDEHLEKILYERIWQREMQITINSPQDRVNNDIQEKGV